MDDKATRERKIRILVQARMLAHSTQSAIRMMARCPLRDTLVKKLSLLDQLIALHRDVTGCTDLTYLEG